MGYLYQSSYYSYLIRVGLGSGEDACIALALFNLCLLGCQSLRETLLRKKHSNSHPLPNKPSPKKAGLNMYFPHQVMHR